MKISDQKENTFEPEIGTIDMYEALLKNLLLRLEAHKSFLFNDFFNSKDETDEKKMLEKVKDMAVTKRAFVFAETILTDLITDLKKG